MLRLTLKLFEDVILKKKKKTNPEETARNTQNERDHTSWNFCCCCGY